MLKQSLHDGWSVRPVSNLENVPAHCRESTPAIVPGCVHTDLLRAGKIADPYGDRVEPTLRWIGQTDWRYETSFTADEKLFAHERIDLAADGLDTVATIELNGRLIARTESMHVGYRFDVRPHLKPGRNTLAITFASAERYATAMEQRLGTLPFLNTRVPFNMIRKMACNFGWDWGPELITCGIWRGIRLEGWSEARIKSCRANLKPIKHQTYISVECELETTNGAPSDGSEWEIHVSVKEPNAPGGSAGEPIRSDYNFPAVSIFTAITGPAQWWWPAGHGEQPLYAVTVQLTGANGENLDSWSRKIGLRTIELDTTQDDIGRAFTLKVNGKPIFCKGFNWIPDDCFLDRACTPERYRTRIQQAVAANANMLRVWGGGIYETDEFYDLCDELGVLVWQDFLFACAAYPEEEPFKNLVEQEARYNVARLSHHASLAIWNGCNENVWGYHDWGWKQSGELKNRTWGLGYYFDLLPRIVKELDPSRPYWAASPWSGDYNVENGLHPNLASHGNKHVWEVWCREPASSYRQFSPRFCSEFGFQGPPTYATLAACLPADQIEANSPGLLAHQKHPAGDLYNAKRLAESFVEPENFDDWHYLLQLNQARGLQTGVEWFRSRMPVCMGTLYWQLNDCWPVNSWSAIDSDGRLKPLWFATRRFYADVLFTIQPGSEKYKSGDPMTLFAINDTDERGVSKTWITRRSFAGQVLAEQEIEIGWAARSNQSFRLDDAITTPVDPATELIAVGFPTAATWFFDADKNLAYPPAQFDAEISYEPGQTRVTITAKSLLRDMLIQIDRLDPAATISDNLITLLPGESFRFDIRSNEKLSKESLTTRPVFNCANYFGKAT